MPISSKPLQIPSFVRKSHTVRYQFNTDKDPYKPLAAIYVLRLALGLRHHLSIQALAELFENELGQLTELASMQVDLNRSEAETNEYEEGPAKTAKTDLIRCLNERLKHLLNGVVCLDSPLVINLQRITDQFGLTSTDQEILVVRLLMNRYPCLTFLINQHSNPCHDAVMVDCLHILTTRPKGEIAKSLASQATLVKMGWIEIMPHAAELEEKIKVPPALLNILTTTHADGETLLKQFFTVCKPGSLLKLNDYPQLQADLDIIQPFLYGALKTGRVGSNLLIHGSEKRGKIELIKALAQHMDATVCKIRRSGKDNLFLHPHDRFAACKLAQYWLTRQKKLGLIMVSDAESILPARQLAPIFSFEENDDPVGKVEDNWLDQQLKNNTSPIFWNVKAAESIHGAYLGKFDYAIALDRTPLNLRRLRIQKVTQTINLSDEWCEHLAKQTELSIKQIAKAADVARLAQQHSCSSAEDIMSKVLNTRYGLLKQKSLTKTMVYSTQYDLRFTNINISSESLLAGLQRTGRGTFCFYGAPGTGKSAFANHLAEQLGIPLHMKRASEILGKYVGQSERNIARMFHQAEKQQAILLVDEADSLISDRRDARQSWEVTMVNEMLTQIEHFSGIFICTTNLMDRLDAASLRRFDFKVKFDYLSSEQRWALFQQECQRLGGEMPRDSQEIQRIKQNVQNLTKLTPGDFAVLSRQVSLLARPMSIDNMVSVLEQECLAKGETFSKIGFVH